MTTGGGETRADVHGSAIQSSAVRSSADVRSSDVTADGLLRSGVALRRLQPERISVRLAGRRIEFVDWGFYAPEPWRNFPHVHSCYEFCYAYAGRGTFRVSGAEHPIGPGELFLARPGDVHDIVAADDDPLGIIYWSWAVLHDGPGPGPGPRTTATATATLPTADPHDTAALLNAFTTGDTRIATVTDSPLPRIALLLAQETATPGPGNTEMITSLATALVLATTRALTNQPTRHQPRPTPGAPTVTTMIRYLHDNYHRPIRLREVAAQVHLSERHAARLFRKHTGCTIHTYLSRHRLETAAQLLADPAHRTTPIATIAHTCGYTDPRHFSESFQRHWGQSPAALRANGGTTQLAPKP